MTNGTDIGPSLPPPGLLHLADFSIRVAPPRTIVDSACGGRRYVEIMGGTVRGDRLSGAILPGGSDDQRIGADGTIHIHARYLIETEDGATLALESTGLRVLLPGDSAAYFITSLQFETQAPGYLWMSQRIFIANGERRDGQVFLSVFEVTA